MLLIPREQPIASSTATTTTTTTTTSSSSNTTFTYNNNCNCTVPADLCGPEPWRLNRKNNRVSTIRILRRSLVPNSEKRSGLRELHKWELQ